ncbi:MAG TPA: type II toxin-antitoxin system prevent-host-death family antitoxin [Chloroflexota bacterium]
MGIGIRKLARQTSQVVEQVASTGRPEIITRHGKPVAALVPIDESALEDWILANAPQFTRAMKEADAEIASGEHGRALDDVLAEIEEEPARR